LADRFKDAAPSEAVRMYEACRNERGQELTQFEFAALVERWVELFRAYPLLKKPMLDQPPTAPQPLRPSWSPKMMTC
jgi:hypothetical protein